MNFQVSSTLSVVSFETFRKAQKPSDAAGCHFSMPQDAHWVEAATSSEEDGCVLPGPPGGPERPLIWAVSDSKMKLSGRKETLCLPMLLDLLVQEFYGIVVSHVS